MAKWQVVLIGLAGAPTLPGCGSGGPPPAPNFGSEDGRKIAELVGELNEAKASPGRFKAMFAAPAPANRKAYDALNFDVVGHPTVTGNQATAVVKVRSDTDQSPRGEKQWAFVKDGEKWKVKSAPLP